MDDVATTPCNARRQAACKLFDLRKRDIPQRRDSGEMFRELPYALFAIGASCIVFFDQIFLPNQLSGFGIQCVKAAFGIQREYQRLTYRRYGARNRNNFV